MTGLARVYEKMPPRALASVVINAQAAGDSETIERVMLAVPRRTYIAPHVDYQRAHESLETALLSIGAEWWRNCAMKLVCTAGVIRGALDDDNGDMAHWDDVHTGWLRAGAVIDAVLRTICTEAGLDEPVIREWLHLPEVSSIELDDEQQGHHDDMVSRWRGSMAN